MEALEINLSFMQKTNVYLKANLLFYAHLEWKLENLVA